MFEQRIVLKAKTNFSGEIILIFIDYSFFSFLKANFQLNFQIMRVLRFITFQIPSYLLIENIIIICQILNDIQLQKFTCKLSFEINIRPSLPRRTD